MVGLVLIAYVAFVLWEDNDEQITQSRASDYLRAVLVVESTV